MSLLSLPKRKMKGKRLYDLSEEDYREYMRGCLSEARQNMYGRRTTAASQISQLLVTLVLVTMAGIVCLHYFGMITLDH